MAEMEVSGVYFLVSRFQLLVVSHEVLSGSWFCILRGFFRRCIG